MTTEAQLQIQVAEYLRRQYPNALFHSDYGSGVKLTARQAAIQKRQNGGLKSWPDMFIAEPRIPEAHYRILSPEESMEASKDGCFYNAEVIPTYYGLFLELKKDGTRIVKAKTPEEWATPHIAEQAKVLRQLRERGYMAEFAVGFNEAKKIIDHYLGGKKWVGTIESQ